MRKNKLCAALVAALLLAMLAATALASVPSAPKEFYYLDQANVLSEATKGEIFFSNQLLNEACGAQIVVAAVNSTNQQAIDDYSYELFNKWGIGNKDTNNGFLLLLAIDDDDYYALCGAKLQSKFTSGAMKDYFDKYLEADFAAKRYDTGVKKMFEAVFERIADTYNADVTVADGIAAYQAWLAADDAQPMAARSGGAMPAGGRAEESSDFMIYVVVFLLIVLVIVLSSRSRRRRVYGGSPIFFFGGPSWRRNPPPPPQPGPGPGPGGYRGYQGPTNPPRPTGIGRNKSWTSGSSGSASGSGSSGGASSGGGWLGGLLRSSGGSGRSSGFRSSGRSSFGSSRGGGGFSRGGGAGRGRH